MLEFLGNTLLVISIICFISAVRYIFHRIEVRQAIDTKLDDLDEMEAEPFYHDYLNKIIFLEEKLGNRVGYEIFEPTWPPGSFIHDSIELQEIAMRIASFLGLSDYCFIVSVSEQREGVAGNIQLNYSGTDVFIEISADILDDRDAAAAVLAHEITHKYMQLNGIMGGHSALDVHDNEILTDITCVFLGLGKTLLNGCRNEEVKTTPVTNGTSYSINVKGYGYLNKRQTAFVYLLVCTMRKNSEKQMLSNLTKRSKKMIYDTKRDYYEYFDKKFHLDNYRREILCGISEDWKQVHDDIAKTKKHLEFINEKIIKQFTEDIGEKTLTLNRFEEQFLSTYPDNIYDPSLKFLRAIILTDEINRAKKVVKKSHQELKKKEKRLAKLHSFVFKI